MLRTKVDTDDTHTREVVTVRAVSYEMWACATGFPGCSPGCCPGCNYSPSLKPFSVSPPAVRCCHKRWRPSGQVFISGKVRSNPVFTFYDLFSSFGTRLKHTPIVWLLPIQAYVLALGISALNCCCCWWWWLFKSIYFIMIMMKNIVLRVDESPCSGWWTELALKFTNANLYLCSEAYMGVYIVRIYK